jgi:hypothetical protein
MFWLLTLERVNRRAAPKSQSRRCPAFVRTLLGDKVSWVKECISCTLPENTD